MVRTYAANVNSLVIRNSLCVFWLAIVLLIFSAFPLFASRNDFSHHSRLDRTYPGIADSGCIFIDEASWQRAGESPECLDPDTKLSRFLIEQLADQIVEGIVASTNGNRNAGGFGDVLVDLSVSVKNSVDTLFVSEDPYWQYYKHCDRWQVVFSRQPHSTRSAVSKRVIGRCRQLIQMFEFSLVENIKTGELIRQEKTVEVVKKIPNQRLGSALRSAYGPTFRVWQELERQISVRYAGLPWFEPLAELLRNDSRFVTIELQRPVSR